MIITTLALSSSFLNLLISILIGSIQETTSFVEYQTEVLVELS